MHRGGESLRAAVTKAERARDKALAAVVAQNKAHRVQVDELVEERSLLVLRLQEEEAENATASAVRDGLVSLLLEVTLHSMAEAGGYDLIEARHAALEEDPLVVVELVRQRMRTLLASSAEQVAEVEASFADQVGRLETQVSALEDELEARDETLDEVRVELAARNVALGELKAAAADSAGAAEDASARAAAAEEAVGATLETLKNSNARLRAELRDTERLLRQSEARILELASLEDYVESVKDVHAKELERMRIQAEWELKDAKMARDRCIALTMERDALASELVAANQKIESYRTNYSTTRLERAEDKVRQLQSALNDARKAGTEAQSKIRALERRLALGKDKYDTLARQLGAKQAQLDSFFSQGSPGSALNMSTASVMLNSSSPGPGPSPGGLNSSMAESVLSSVSARSSGHPRNTESSAAAATAVSVDTIPGHVDAYKAKLRERDELIQELRGKVRSLMSQEHARRVAYKSFELERAAYLKEIGQLRRKVGDLAPAWKDSSATRGGEDSLESSSLYLEPQSDVSVMQLRSRNRALEAQVAELNNIKAMMAATSDAYARLVGLVEDMGIDVGDMVASSPRPLPSTSFSSPASDRPRSARPESVPSTPTRSPSRFQTPRRGKPRDGSITPLTALQERYQSPTGYGNSGNINSPGFGPEGLSFSRAASDDLYHPTSPLPYRPGSVGSTRSSLSIGHML